MSTHIDNYMSYNDIDMLSVEVFILLHRFE